LRDELADFLKRRNVSVMLRVPVSEARLIASVKSAGKVHREKYEDDGSIVIEASVPGPLEGYCAPYAVDDVDWEESEGRRA